MGSKCRRENRPQVEQGRPDVSTLTEDHGQGIQACQFQYDSHKGLSLAMAFLQHK